MAQLEVMGAYEGPGEQKTAETLATGLPDSWVVIAGRKLPGANRDDVDLIVVGDNLVFVLEEKSWGPRVIADDSYWIVNDGDRRRNPLDRVGQLARKIAGHLRDHAHGYRQLTGQHVVSGVVLSHDRLELYSGRNHDRSERIYPLSLAVAELVAIDRDHVHGIRPVRGAVLGRLLDLPQAEAHPQMIGVYRILGRHDSEGIEVAYEAEGADGTRVILKCYDTHQLSDFGDPGEYLKRETRALNRLADLARTWRALPYFVDENHRVFVVPLVPPVEGRNLRASMQQLDPARPDGRLEGQTAWAVVSDAFAALDEVHVEGLVHRALHPRRIWLGRRLRVKFSDFHLARISDEQTIHAWVGDDAGDAYRAPECAADVRLAKPASDVFSLALCMIEWILGRDATELTVDEMRALLGVEWPWAGELLKALNGSEAERPTAPAMVEALAALRPDRPVPSAPAAEDLDGPSEAQPVVFAPGALIAGRYQILDKLGRGGFATTWMAWDTRTDARRVLKQFTRDLPEDAKTEFQAAEELKHDRCARVWDIQVEESPNYLVCDYTPGTSLAALDPVPEVEVFRTITEQILDALTYVHGRDRVHGDVTPGNIIVADGGTEATLIDFGLSATRGARPAGWHPRFAAPEVIKGSPLTAAADLFGLAASVIYAMLGRYAGRPTDGPGGGWQMIGPTETEELQWGPDGVALLGVLFKAVDPDPAKRISSAQVFKELVRAARPHEQDVQPGEWRHNPAVLAIRQLYRASSAGNSGNRGLDDEFAKATYVPTKLDDSLLPDVMAGRLSVVLLTGNPGDGKTSFLVTLGDALKAAGAVVEEEDAAGWRISYQDRLFAAVFDASESHGDLSSDDLVMSALRPVVDSGGSAATALIAVNDGRLLQFFMDYEDEFEDLAHSVRLQLNGRESDDPRVVVVDLKRRALAALPGEEGLATRVLDVLTADEHWEACTGCHARASCPILSNRNLLRSSGRDAFGELVLTSHLRRRRRATFRDVRSAAAWVLTGDRDCLDVHEVLLDGGSPDLLDDALAFDLAFSDESADYLVSEWSQIDPASSAVPAVDAARREAAGVLGDRFASFSSVESVSRALYFGHWMSDRVGPEGLRAYRYFDEFVDMLRGSDPDQALRRTLLGMSRIVGAFGFMGQGLAINSGQAADWAVLHLLDAAGFSLEPPAVASRFVEWIPDQLHLRHERGASLALSLDTAEIILRAADGEIIEDLASDSIRQEIDGFVTRLSREPSRSVRIVDASGSVHVASIDGDKIRLEA